MCRVPFAWCLFQVPAFLILFVPRNLLSPYILFRPVISALSHSSCKKIKLCITSIISMERMGMVASLPCEKLRAQDLNRAKGSSCTHVVNEVGRNLWRSSNPLAQSRVSWGRLLQTVSSWVLGSLWWKFNNLFQCLTTCTFFSFFLF